jgi:hypothetical protein
LDSLADGPGFAGSEGESNLKIRRESLDFRSSGPYLHPCSQTLAWNLTGEVENQWFRRVSRFLWIPDFCWPKAKKPSNSWFQCPESPRTAPIDEG